MINVQKNRRIQRKKNQPIDMAPLIDMIFILLIFFIVTSTFAPETSIEIERPEMSSVSNVPAKSLNILINKSGKITIEDLETPLHQVESLIKAQKNAHPQLTVLVLSDKETPLGKVLSVLDSCRRAGVDPGIAAEEVDNK